MSNNDSDKNKDFLESPIQSLHTLDADILASMKDENYASNIVKVITHTKDQKEGAKDKENSNILNKTVSKHSFKFNVNSIYFYVGLSVFLLSAIGGTAYYVVQKTIQETLPKSDTPVSTSTVSTSGTSTIPKQITITQKNIFNAEVILPIEINKLTKIQIINLIDITKKKLIGEGIKDNINISLSADIDFASFLNKIQYSGPDSLIRSITSDKIYNFGLYHNKKGDFDVYLITKIDSFDLGFSSMLEWERSIPVDLLQIYTYPTDNIEESTSTSSPKLSIAQKNPLFMDKVIKNIDVRMYIDPIKGTRIIYGFINKKYLLITSGENAFIDIVNKLTVNNILR